MAQDATDFSQISATSAGLPALRQDPLTHLAGYAAAWYLPQEDLLRSPRVVSGTIVGNLALALGAVWRPLPCTPHTLRVDEKPKADRGGTVYQVRVQAQRPQPTPAVLTALAALDRRRLLLLVQEHGGALRLIGGREECVRLLTGSEGQHPGTRAGLDLELAGETTRLAPYYSGVVALAEGALAPPPAAGSIRVLDGRGRLRLTVPASGYDIVIEGPFRTEVILQAQ